MRVSGCESKNGNAGRTDNRFFTPENPQKSRLGIWIFLTFEILLFGGLFCWYWITRSNHPDMFIYAQKYLNIPLGGIGTAILLISSFAISMAVRASRLSHWKLLAALLTLTLICAAGFLCVKGIECNAMWKYGLFPEVLTSAEKQESAYEMSPVVDTGTRPPVNSSHRTGRNLEGESSTGECGMSGVPTPSSATGAHGKAIDTLQQLQNDAATGKNTDGTTNSTSSSTEKPVTDSTSQGQSDSGTSFTDTADKHASTGEYESARRFFKIYFPITGIFVLHVICGMAALLALIFNYRGLYFRTPRAVSAREFRTSVAFFALYWYLIVLAGICLFAVVYLV